MVFLAHQGLAHQSITAYLSGVRNLAIANGDTPVDRDKMPRLRLALRGVAHSPSPQGGTRPRRDTSLPPHYWCDYASASGGMVW